MKSPASFLHIMLLFIAPIATFALTTAHTPPATTQPDIIISDQPPSATSTSQPSRITKVGTIKYQGPHTWKGVVQVTSDNATYEDGSITADARGVPEGVTLAGDRRNITLRNLTFDGVGNGITVGNNQKVNDFTIDNCHFINCRSPIASSQDHLEGSRGYGLWGSGGRNWEIKNSSFQTKCNPSQNPEQLDSSSQYAARLGAVHGLNVRNTKFENHNGKASVWMMFVKMASFKDVQFIGGRVCMGSRPGDVGGVESGDCRNIIFSDCTFTFGTYEDWPASIVLSPGCDGIRFERCTFKTDGDWWIDIDSRGMSNISWNNQCTWNGQPIVGYTGVRSSMSEEEMAEKKIAPRE